MKMKIFCISAIIFFVVLLFSASSPVSATDHTVSGSNFQSIKDSVDSASSGDRILLSSKTYSSSGSAITVTGDKNITIQGQSNTNRATLNANNLHGILYISEGSSATIRYVNFVNGGFTGCSLGVYGTILIENCTFINSKGDSGSAITINATASNTIIRNCNFTNNYANNHGDNDYTAGGAICIHGADNVEIRNCYFSGNTALDSGGALVIRNDATNTKIIGCTFVNNQAPTGGAIYNQLASTTISGCTFTNNKATGSGGAIYSIDLLNISDSSFNSNTAKNGGAIYSTNQLRLTGSSFSANTVTADGGAIYSTSTISIGSSSFNKNTAKNNGGGLYTTGSSRSTITSSKFTSNMAKYGGAVYNNGSLSIQSSTFKSNKANLYGGAIYVNKNLNITGGSITGNSANYGSAVFNLATLRISKVSINSNLAKVIGIYLKYPASAKPSKKITINVFLKTGDNIIGAIYNKKGSTYIDGSRKNVLTYTPSKTFSSSIGGLTKNIKSDSKGTATRTHTVGKNAKKVTVSASYSQSGQKWSITKSITVSKTAKSTTKTATITKPGSSKSTSTTSTTTPATSSKNNGANVKISFSNHEYSHLASLVNMDDYTVSSKKISYWNLKSDKNLIGVTDYLYKVDKNGWYYGSLNSKDGIDWKKLGGKPSISGTWFDLTFSSKEKYSIGKIVPRYTNNTSNGVVMFFVSVKTSINHNSLTPYIAYTYNLVNKKDKSKKTVRFFEKSDTSIYFAFDESSKSLKDYNKYLVNSKPAPTNNKDITSLTKNIISKISGELTPAKKAEALFKWVRDNIDYPDKGYSSSVKLATGTLSSRVANCVDQSSLLVSMFRTAKIPSRYEHYKPCTFRSGLVVGHVWVSLYAGGKWVEVDTTSRSNSYGKIVNVVKRGNKIGPYIIVPLLR